MRCLNREAREECEAREELLVFFAVFAGFAVFVVSVGVFMGRKTSRREFLLTTLALPIAGAALTAQTQTCLLYTSDAADE